MHDLDEERVMTEFLLGGLDAVDKGRIADRLGDDPDYFEAMAALEDDLILRWHRGELSAGQSQLFKDAYLSAPARRARVDSSLAWLDAANAWKAAADARWWNKLVSWMTMPANVSRFTLVATSAVVIVAATVAGYLAADATRRPFGATRENAARPAQASAARQFTLAFNLTALGERGPATSSSLDRVRVPLNATEVQFTVEVPGAPNDGPFTVELAAVDRGTIAQLGPPRISRSGGGPAFTVTVAAGELPDGDYLLTLRKVAGGAAEIVARQSFRVTRDGN